MPRLARNRPSNSTGSPFFRPVLSIDVRSRRRKATGRNGAKAGHQRQAGSERDDQRDS
jgi:hypothetical protein